MLLFHLHLQFLYCFANSVAVPIPIPIPTDVNENVSGIEFKQKQLRNVIYLENTIPTVNV